MKNYIKENKLAVLIVVSALIIGIIVGASIVTKISVEEAKSIYGSINKSVSESTPAAAFVSSLKLRFKCLGILFLCGLAVIGAPAAVAYTGILGYALGFTVGFMVRYYGLLGLLAAFGGILPHYILLLPSFICMGISGINFSNKLLRGERNISDGFKSYLAKACLIAIPVFAACVAEGFLSSFLLKKILALII